MRRIAKEGPRTELVVTVGWHLHNFYTALEDLFGRVAAELNAAPVQGPRSHAALLQRMARAVPEVRPAVISRPTMLALDELRRFRHVFRHAYTYALQWEKIAPLAAALPELMAALQRDLTTFDRFLAGAVSALEE